MTQDIAVGIVLYNSLDDLPRCIEALRSQTHPVRIFALDNASPDDSGGWVRQQAPDVTLIVSADNLGFGKGHNRLIEASSPTDYYMPLNPDIVLEPGYIERLAAAMTAQNAAWGSGKLLLMDADGQPTGQIYSAGHALYRDGYAVNIGFELPDGPEYDQAREVFGAPGAAPLLSRKLIDQLSTDDHLFDPDIFMYQEDTDLDWRARRQGLRCWYEASARALHRGSKPRESLRVHAIGNRYLSALKNAYIIDLLTYNIPLILAHASLRTVLTPRHGIQLWRHLLRGAPVFLRKREPSILSREAMHTWYQWSREQPTGSVQSLSQRLQAFLKRRRV